MRTEEEIEAFQQDINALCIRYIREFDLDIEDMAYVLFSQEIMLITEAVRAELESGDERWSTSTA